MNYKLIGFYLGKIFCIVSAFLLLPIGVAAIYKEWSQVVPFVVALICYWTVGIALSVFLKPKTKKLRSKEGLIIVGLSWVTISLIGALPFVIGGAIPNYLDALFETISGFTTTGATILSNIDKLPKSILFWRSFTHWLGGMGILVFILAVMPGTDGSTYHLFKFESPGPQVGKMTSKTRHTATILYLIYFAFTLLEAGLLVIDKNVNFFDAITTAMSTAGTGGFANYDDSIAHFNSVYVEMIVALFMFLFSLNFNLYYLLILKHFRSIVKDEELRFYVCYVLLAVFAIALNTMAVYGNFVDSLRYSSFTVLSLTSSTGFAVAEFNVWPQLSQNILLLCMLIGACAGSTGGGLKASRVLILIKAGYSHLLNVLHPHSVQVVKLHGEKINQETVDGVVNYFLVYVMIFIGAMFLLSIDGGELKNTFSTTLSCLNNDGPYLAGAFEGYAGFGWFSKIVYMVLMLVGRLEIFPMLLLFVPKTWKKSF